MSHVAEATALEQVAPQGLVGAVSASGGLRLLHVRAAGSDALEVELEQPNGAGRVVVRLGPLDAQCAVRGRRAGARYRAQRSRVDEPERARLGGAIAALVRLADDFLGANPGASLGELPARWRSPARRIDLTPAGLMELLGIRLGDAVGGGYALEAIHPASVATEGDGAALRLDVVLANAAGQRIVLQVGPAAVSHAMARSHHFSLSYLTRGRHASDDAVAAATALALLFELRDPPELEVRHPAATSLPSDLAPRLTAPRRSDESLNLAIDADCGQACAFCSVKSLAPPWREGAGAEARLAALVATLRSNAEAGVRRVRLNGYDPLAYERILDVARAITECGYERVDVYSPCTALAEQGGLEALLEALPAEVWFYVPLYGATPEVHDAVVGTPGAHARVRAALAALVGRLPRERVVCTCVAVPANLTSLRGLRDHVEGDLGLGFLTQTPYPSSEAPGDAYRGAVASFTAIAEATVVAGERPLLVRGVPPCVYRQVGQARGVPLAEVVRCAALPPRLPGREYGSERFRHQAPHVQQSAFVAAAVACPHTQRCALRPACAGEVLSSYADAHGLEELRPVPLATLLGVEELPADESSF
ncbi:MAG: hypothetical protein IT376_07245 [Polyangiaceae bacterium]|nr:hypothetical protein [Polyangiaceae bacterium]